MQSKKFNFSRECAYYSQLVLTFLAWSGGCQTTLGNVCATKEYYFKNNIMLYNKLNLYLILPTFKSEAFGHFRSLSLGHLDIF